MYVALTVTDDPMPLYEAAKFALAHPTKPIEYKWNADLPTLNPIGPAWVSVNDDPDIPCTMLDPWTIKTQCKGIVRIGWLDKPHTYKTSEIYAISDGERVSFLQRVLEGTRRMVWGYNWHSYKNVVAGWYPLIEATFVPEESPQ